MIAGNGLNYAALLRAYQRRNGGNAGIPSRREAIQEAAFAELQAEGAFPIDRNEANNVAIYHMLANIAAALGVNTAEVDSQAASPQYLRLVSPNALSPDEIQHEDDQQTRQAFAQLLAHAKR